MSISSAIEKARPNLSASSVKTYTSILSSLYKKVFGTEEPDLHRFNDAKAILEHLKDKEPARRKTILSALVVLTGNDAFKVQMGHDVAMFNQDNQKQIMSDKQRASDISPEQVRAVFDHLEAQAASIYKKKHFTVSDLLQIQDYILLALLGGFYIAPRRSMDYTAFKLKNIDREKDNYLDKNTLVFNAYKTAGTYGKQEVDCPKELKAILTKWGKVNPTDFLFFDSAMQQLSSVKITQKLNKVFGGRAISVNQLRHTYLTGRFAAYTKEQKEVAKTMTEMGSSPAVLNQYVKF